VYYKTLSLSVCYFEQNSPYVSARSNSVVFDSEKPQFSGAASFWIVVVVAPCGVANADLKVPVHAIVAGGIILKDLIGTLQSPIPIYY
jgi:hypothetical protein